MVCKTFYVNSNTTLVKVNHVPLVAGTAVSFNSNTTLVKVNRITGVMLIRKITFKYNSC